MKYIVNQTAAAAVIVIGAAAIGLPDVQAAEPSTPDPHDPFEAYVSAGGAHEDNVFRMSGRAEALGVLGTDQLDDWYWYAEAGFSANHVGASQRFQVDGSVNRRTYDTFDFLDHTGGALIATGEWTLPADYRGNLGYGYRRHLQSFANKNTTVQDVVDEHSVQGGVEKTLGERWLLRFGAAGADLGFSTNDSLDKQRLDGEAELQYAASQQSTFGVLATYTKSDFDVNDTRDFSGWSLGPSFRWQLTTSLLLLTNMGYTHRGLDDSNGEISDYDGVTGFAAARWRPGERFSSELRVFRDVSNLGGEISEYTERTGLRLQPRWRITPKLTSELSLAYEQRDFGTVETTAFDREDDYLLADVSVSFEPGRRLLLTLGYGYEYRDSNDPIQDFIGRIVHAEVRLNI